MPGKFRLEIVTPQAERFAGDVIALRVPAYEGSLGVMAQHAPMLIEVVPGVIHITPLEGPTEVLGVAGGFLEVGENRAILLADAAERPEEIDIRRAEAARKRAENRLKEQHKHVDLDRAELALKRALARLHVAGEIKRFSARR